MKKLLVLGASLAALNGTAIAESIDFVQRDTKSFVKNELLVNDESFHSIRDVRIELVEETYQAEREFRPFEKIKRYFSRTTRKELGEVILVVDQLIALGQKVWPIVEAGKPVVSTGFSPVSVLPKEAATSPFELSGWNSPISRKYRVFYENFYGIDVIDFTFTVHYQAGGERDGKGNYLTGVKVTPSNLSVSWGFEFDASSEVIAITNRGTSEDPIAGLTIQVKYVAKSILKEIRSSNTFHISGDGRFTRLE